MQVWRESESDAPRRVAPDTIAARAPSEGDPRIEAVRDRDSFVSAPLIQ